jgi:hypothetical protein
MRSRYNRAEIDIFLKKALTDIGPQGFSSMKLLELEKCLRQRDTAQMLPAKTVLRAAINSFRAALWPETAPKRLSNRFRT